MAAAAASQVFAFGTIRGMGQNAEHERITRRALACPDSGRMCMQPRTLDELAGADRSFGAVGAPDRGRLIFQAKAHCDRGDYLNVVGYPQSADQAQANLRSCRAWMAAHIDAAVRDAAGLLDAHGRIRADQVGLNCVFVGRVKGRAKCNVLEDFGIALHTAQDFYAHSNWVDVADPRRPPGLDNPPGLGRTGPAPWMSLRGDPPFPTGLISGCYGAPEARACRRRVMHAALNKDTGEIDPRIGAGTSPRGRIGSNFARAVEAASADTRDKWDLLRERLTATYGVTRARLMACAIARDEPLSACPNPQD
jgi:hypothetical protein